MMANRIVGLMRFSLVTERNRSSFRQTREGSLEDSVALIHNMARLEQRLALFEAMPLKCFEGQTCQDFRLVVLTSTLIPKPIKRRLRKLAETRPFLTIKTAPPERSLSVAARACVGVGDGPLVTFRIDDDDALAPDFIENLAAAAARTPPGGMITFERGLYLQPDGADFLLQERVYRNIAIGLATVSTDARTIFDRGSHVKADRFAVHVESRPESWIRLLHQGSDSGARIDPSMPAERIAPGGLAARLPEFAHLDFPAVHAALSVSARQPDRH